MFSDLPPTITLFFVWHLSFGRKIEPWLRTLSARAERRQEKEAIPSSWFFPSPLQTDRATMLGASPMCSLFLGNRVCWCHATTVSRKHQYHKSSSLGDGEYWHVPCLLLYTSVDSLSLNWQKCTICRSSQGAVIRCSDCMKEYHVSCAWKNGYKFGFEIQPVRYLGKISPSWTEWFILFD